jgi:hypothetical protein
VGISSFTDLQTTIVGKRAKADGLSFKETSNTIWWKLILDNEIVGICGLIKANQNTWRIKSVFILPEWRRQGFYTVAAWVMMLKAYSLNGKYVQAIVRPHSGLALKRIGWSDKDGKQKNLVHIDIEKLFKDIDINQNPISMMLDLFPEVE